MRAKFILILKNSAQKMKSVITIQICLILFGFSSRLLAQSVILDGEYFVVVRQRVDSDHKVERLNSIEYSIFTYKGSFEKKWKIFSEPSHHVFLDPGGKCLVLCPYVFLNDDKQVFLRFFNSDGLLKEFRVKDFLRLEDLKYEHSPATSAGVASGGLKIFSDKLEIGEKWQLGLILPSSDVSSVEGKLGKDECFFYWFFGEFNA